MSNSSEVTTDHEKIKKWVEERDGKPARITNADGQSGSALLRIDFPGGAQENLEEMDWNEFFRQFEKNDLAFLYQEETQDGSTSRFNKFVDRSKVK